MRTALIVSFILHGGLVAAMQTAFPIALFQTPVQVYHVELIRPPMDPVDDDAGGTDLSAETPEDKKPPEPTEDTISLDTKDKKYVSYARIIKEKLLSRWEYPQAARDNLIEGTCLVLFTLDRQGALQGIRILQAASHPILDKEAERAIQAASPFPPFPGSVTVQRLNIKANFAYRLTSKRH